MTMNPNRTPEQKLAYLRELVEFEDGAMLRGWEEGLFKRFWPGRYWKLRYEWLRDKLREAL